MGVMGMRRDAEAELNLPPGFRFHPTDEELVIHYLCRKAASQRLPVPIIAEVDLYKYNPWELPEKALFGQREWYFFTPRDRKYPNGSRPNRTAGSGYWKATGADKPVSARGSSRPLGIKKALVFYHGKAPKGIKTDWIMHEYRLADTDRSPSKKASGLRLDDWVLCRLYNKRNNWEKAQTMKVESSFAESSLETNDDVHSEIFRTPESDVEYEAFSELDDICRPGINSYQASSAGLGHWTSTSCPAPSNFQMAERMKEEDDWFMDLKLDDIQSSIGAAGPVPAMDILNQDYYFSSAVGSPFLRSSQLSMPPPY